MNETHLPNSRENLPGMKYFHNDREVTRGEALDLLNGYTDPGKWLRRSEVLALRSGEAIMSSEEFGSLRFQMTL